MSDTRSALARTRGQGAAKEGLRHWWGQRVTALLLIPLVIWFVIGLVIHTGADHAAVTDWLSEPVTYGLMLVLLGAAFWHGALGLQAVIEDYIAKCRRYEEPLVPTDGGVGRARREELYRQHWANRSNGRLCFSHHHRVCGLIHGQWQSLRGGRPQL